MKRKENCFVFFACLLFVATFFTGAPLVAQQIISTTPTAGAFAIATEKGVADIMVDEHDHTLVKKAASLLQQDLKTVTGKTPRMRRSLASHTSPVIIIGSVDSSSLIQQLIKDNKISTRNLTGKWEAWQVQVVSQPVKGIDKALVIAGSDRRGTAYGVMTLSQQMGVSPWYWWADVPVEKKKALFVAANTFTTDAPKVKYRGIFINDEAPAFSGWAKEKFGGANHVTYEKVFELLLRLRANYLWPAMWNNAFNDDDKLNPVLAHQWGIVMGTSHHEPMQRSQQEWKRYGKGAWDYGQNDSVLRQFWRTGIQNMGNHESIVTVGMRGDGDKPMVEGTATTMLEKIVADQRMIIEGVTRKPAAATPQLWALYKEVQDYYDKGMRVPDDVTLLISDDNWGNIRKLPALNEKPRSGGYGIYYHFDYVGDPRNYKWINTNNIARVWEQMHLAWEYNARQIWIVNVGDIKPMEFPISFFLDYAWNPSTWNENNLRSYYTQWAIMQFGNKYGEEIGEIVRLYGQYAARRKPELLDANTYSILNYNEWAQVVNDFNQLLARAEKINNELPAAYRDAYFQVVLHPLKANANLHEMYQAVAWNRYYATQKNVLANSFADKAKRLYENDSLISLQYHQIANGKWHHMMDQVHIGYRSWNDPRTNKMPEVKYVSADTGVAMKGEQTEKPAQTAENLIHGDTGTIFYEKNGYVSIEAEHFTRSINTQGIQWKVIPDIGRTASGISPFPVTAPQQQPGNNGPHTEYDFYNYDTGAITLQAHFSPTLNFQNEPTGLQYAVSIDEEKPQLISINTYNQVNTWREWVANNIIIKKTQHTNLSSGKHVLKFWMVQPGVVLQKLVLDFGGVKQSYLGPPETMIRRESNK
jgi:hypothetical protein